MCALGLKPKQVYRGRGQSKTLFLPLRLPKWCSTLQASSLHIVSCIFLLTTNVYWLLCQPQFFGTEAWHWSSSIFCWPWRFLTSMDEKLDKKISNSEFQCLIFGFRHCAYTAPTNISKISWKCIIWRKTNTVKDYKRGFEDVVLIQLIDECTSGVSSALIGRNQNLIGLHPYYYTRGCWWILKVGIHGVKSTLLWIETSVVKGFFSKILILEDNF